MKKIFTILLALSALSIIVSGCKKAEEAPAEGDKTATEKTEGEAAK